MLKWSEKAWCPFYHVSDIIVHLGRQRGGGVPHRKNELRPYLVVSAPSAGVLNVHEAINVPLQVRNEERVHEMRSFDGDPPPPPLCLPR